MHTDLKYNVRVSYMQTKRYSMGVAMKSLKVNFLYAI